MDNAFQFRVAKRGDFYEVREVRFDLYGELESATDRVLSPVFSSLNDLRGWVEEIGVAMAMPAVDLDFLLPVQCCSPTSTQNLDAFTRLNTEIVDKALRKRKFKPSSVREKLRNIARDR
jgi:hypothetical protein